MRTYRISVSGPDVQVGHHVVNVSAGSFSAATNRALRYLKMLGIKVDGRRVRRLAIVAEVVDPRPDSTASGAAEDCAK